MLDAGLFLSEKVSSTRRTNKEKNDRTYVSEQPLPKHSSSTIQPVDNRIGVFLHRSRKDDESVPGRDLGESDAKVSFVPSKR